MAGYIRQHRQHDPPLGEIPVPHGPSTGTEHEHYPQHGAPATEHEKEIFKHLTNPDDAFTPEGVYWADLPFWKRLSFVRQVDHAESMRELKTISTLR